MVLSIGVVRNSGHLEPETVSHGEIAEADHSLRFSMPWRSQGTAIMAPTLVVNREEAGAFYWSESLQDWHPATTAPEAPYLEETPPDRNRFYRSQY